MKSRTKRLSLWPALIVAGGTVTVCAVILLLRSLFLLGAWENQNFINFLAAWIPFVLSILLAFIPDSQMPLKRRIAWRSCVIFGGLLYSVLLWHQQTLAQTAADAAQRQLLGESVNKSNEHSDEQIGKVRADVQSVKDDVSKTENKLSRLVQESETSINASIGKVGKPEPPEFPDLVFSLFSDKATNDDFPIHRQLIDRDKDGNVPVDVFFLNKSVTAADAIDVWIGLCDDCAFAAEPAGFDRPSGMSEHMRHRFIPLLNGDTGFPRTTILVKPPNSASFQMFFRYSCKSCGKRRDPQIVTVLMTPELNVGPKFQMPRPQHF